jgi:hypothetical protein
MFEYQCKIVKVIDGDTADVDIDLGFGVWMKKQRIRFYGVDTPESRTSDILGEFLLDQKLEDTIIKTTVNEELIRTHNAVRYFGQSKDDIAEEHIRNREFLDD